MPTPSNRESPNGATPPNVLLDAGLNAAEEFDADADVSVEINAEEGDEGATKKPEANAEAQALETEARSTGWVSKEDWIERHGSERGWKPAADWIDYRRNALPIVQQELRETKAQLETMQRERAEEKRIAAEQQTNYERQSLKAQIRQAREDNDWDKVDELTDKLFELRAAPKAAATNQVDPTVKRSFENFAAGNPWVKADQQLAKVFAVQLKQVMDAGGAANLDDALDMAKDLTRRMYPEKFKPRSTTPMAENGAAHGSSTANTRAWSQVKPELRKQYETMFDGKDPKKWKAQVLAELPAEAFGG